MGSKRQYWAHMGGVYFWQLTELPHQIGLIRTIEESYLFVVKVGVSSLKTTHAIAVLSVFIFLS